MEKQSKQKTVYALSIRMSDNEAWSAPSFYRTKGEQNRCEQVNRIIGGIRTHSFDKKVDADEVSELCD